MTIIIPTWLIITIVCLFTIRMLVGIRRSAILIKGLKEVWPYIKKALDNGEDINIKYDCTCK